MNQGSPAQALRQPNANSVQLGLLCFIALSPSLGTAIAALGRLFLYVWVLGAMVLPYARCANDDTWRRLRPVTIAVVLVCFYFGLSTAWSLADWTEAWWSWSRYARLLAIPLIYYLITSRAQGRVVLRVFLLTQVFVGLSSWLLVMGIHAPWISAVDPDTAFASYGTYLEESIAQAATAGLLWFQRDSIFGPRARAWALVAALSSVLLVLFVLHGRTGQVAMIGVIALACLKALPRKIRPLGLLIPLLAASALWFTSPVFHQRGAAAYDEVLHFYQDEKIDTSSGIRLHFWTVSLKNIAERPVFGAGAGSWKYTYQQQTATLSQSGGKVIQGADDPHELFLLWSVEGGLLGLGLLIAGLATVLKQARHLSEPDSWSLRALVLVLVISNLFNSTFHYIGIGDFFCVGIGILLSLLSTAPQPHPSRALPV